MLAFGDSIFHISCVYRSRKPLVESDIIHDEGTFFSSHVIRVLLDYLDHGIKPARRRNRFIDTDSVPILIGSYPTPFQFVSGSLESWTILARMSETVIFRLDRQNASMRKPSALEDVVSERRAYLRIGFLYKSMTTEPSSVIHFSALQSLFKGGLNWKSISGRWSRSKPQSLWSGWYEVTSEPRPAARGCAERYQE